jgi:hypothetical protein
MVMEGVALNYSQWLLEQGESRSHGKLVHPAWGVELTVAVSPSSFHWNDGYYIGNVNGACINFRWNVAGMG